MKVIIAAAGTGGHINPGLAIANKIKKENQDAEIIFVGTSRGLENDLVPRAGYKLKTIEAYGFSKQISISNFRKMIKTAKGFKQARKIVGEFKPDIVIGTGGYICGAVITAASKQGIPTLLHESNSFPGRAIKMLAPKTDTILVSFEDAIARIKNAKNVVFTGTPVKIKRKEYTSNEKEKIIKDVGLRTGQPIVLVFGGSQGAKRINDTLLEIIKSKLNNNYQIIWATGPKQYDIIKDELENDKININNVKDIKIMPYIYNMEELMNVVDIIVARSGAMTITEISNLGKASILVPLPNVSHDHQLYNAKALEKVGAAKIILDGEITGKKLNNQIGQIISNKSNLKAMEQNALKMATTDAEEKIYNEIKKLVK